MLGPRPLLIDPLRGARGVLVDVVPVQLILVQTVEDGLSGAMFSLILVVLASADSESSAPPTDTARTSMICRSSTSSTEDRPRPSPSRRGAPTLRWQEVSRGFDVLTLTGGPRRPPSPSISNRSGEQRTTKQRDGCHSATDLLALLRRTLTITEAPTERTPSTMPRSFPICNDSVDQSCCTVVVWSSSSSLVGAGRSCQKCQTGGRACAEQ